MTTLTLAEVLDKVALPRHLLLSAIPFVLLAACLTTFAGTRRRFRVHLCIALLLVLCGHIWLQIFTKLTDYDIAVLAIREYRYATDRDYQVDMLIAFSAALLSVPFAALSGYVIGWAFARHRQLQADLGG
ncbi:MAG: hypothetical protein ABL309_07480 [Phycisphaerales bacterium]